jgi:putative transposase
VVDYVRDWSDKTDIPMKRFLPWIDVSSSKFYDWIERFGKVNEHNDWVPRDHWLTKDEKQRICAFAIAHPLEGYRQKTYMMLDADPASNDYVACSPSSVYRVLKANGLLNGSNPGPSKKGTGFVQPTAAHEHWHIDISYLNIAGTFFFLGSVLDGYSRSIVHWEIREKMQERDFETILQRAREAYPDARPRIISDNGPQFVSRDFKEFIKIAGMTHVKTSPYYPQSNGKIERWHKTLKGDMIRVMVPLTPEDARRLTAEYVEHYNTARLHSAIGYVTPKDMLEGRQKEIHAARDLKLAAAREQRRLKRQAKDEEPTPVSPSPTRPVVDFAAMRAVVTMAMVLPLIGCTTGQTRGSQYQGPCPLHGFNQGTARCFSANLDKNCFHCFKCGQSGNALDLYAKATKQLPYDAALDLCAKLNIPVPTLPPPKVRNREEEPVAPKEKNGTMPEGQL